MKRDNEIDAAHRACLKAAGFVKRGEIASALEELRAAQETLMVVANLDEEPLDFTVAGQAP